MPHKEVAVVVAMRREVVPLLAGIGARQADGIEFYELEDAVVAVGGIGRRAAGKTAEALMAQYSPSVLVSAGIAGALMPDGKVGSVVYAREVVDADSGARFVTQSGEGTVVTVSSVRGPGDKRALAERWNADAVEMEASAVAIVAQKHGKEFLAIKAISDELDFKMPPLGKFVSKSGKFEMVRFVLFLAVRPKWWGPARHLSANSHAASVNLSHALQHLIKDGLKVPGLKVPEARVFGA